MSGLEIWSWAQINKRRSWQFFEYAENIWGNNGEWLGKHLEGVVPDGHFLFDWSSIFLIRYEDPIFMFFNIYRSQSVCKKENKVPNRKLCTLKIILIFSALLTQPKWPEILKCWECPNLLPTAGLRMLHPYYRKEFISRGKLWPLHHEKILAYVPTTVKSYWAGRREAFTRIIFLYFCLWLLVQFLLERFGDLRDIFNCRHTLSPPSTTMKSQGQNQFFKHILRLLFHGFEISLFSPIRREHMHFM